MLTGFSTSFRFDRPPAALSCKQKLGTWFHQNGWCHMFASDGEPLWTSKEFTSFLAGNGIFHRLSSAYHPRSNGAAEHGVKVFNQLYLKTLLAKQDFLTAWSLWQDTPRCLGDLSPSALWFGRQLRHPSVFTPHSGFPANQLQIAQDQALKRWQLSEHSQDSGNKRKFPD